MKDHLQTLIETSASPLEGRNRVREYLQARLLQSLQEAGALIPLAFHGGTALRFLFGLPRYSEDLDFALERSDRVYDFRAYLKRIRSDLAAEGYVVSLRVKDDKPVHGAFVGFPGLLHEFGLSPHPDEAMSIKLEVDTRAPAGAELTTTIVRRPIVLRLQHHDRSSLFAGKLHAILARPYAKGRDLYDLMWYLSDPGWPQPNLTQLNNALRQTGWVHDELTEETWRQPLRQRLTGMDWSRIRQDVAPFIERSVELSLLQPDTFERLLD